MCVALQKKRGVESDVKQMYVWPYRSSHTGAKLFHCFLIFLIIFKAGSA